MSPLAGPVHAAALVLAAAGIAKLARPGGTTAALRALRLPASATTARALGFAEIVIAGAVLGGASPWALVVAAALHVGFAVAALGLERAAVGCGCFGAGAPVNHTHVATALVAAALLAVGATDDPSSFADAASATPGRGVPYAVLVGLLAAGEVLLLTALPDAQAAARAVQRDE